MIKKIFLYIIIGILLLPFSSSAYFQVQTGDFYNKTATSVRLNASATQYGVTPSKMHIGIGYNTTKTSNQYCDSSFVKDIDFEIYPKNYSTGDKVPEIINASREVSNLTPNTKYYYCAGAGTYNVFPNGKLFGYYKEFTTLPKVTLSADKVSVASGKSIILTWKVDGKPTSNCVANEGWSGSKNPNGGTELIQNIKNPTVFRIKCTNELGESGESEVKILIDGEDLIKSGTVKTLPHKDLGGGEPEFIVEVTDKSAKLQGNLSALFANKNPEHCKNGVKDVNETGTDIGGSCNGAYAYFRISKVTIPPLFCNDIFGSNMIAVTATNQGNTKIPGGKLKNAGKFSGTIYTLEPDTEYAYCAMVSNHPTTPTEIEYGQVVRFRTNPCFNCPHTTVRTLKPTKITSSSAILQGNYNSTRNIKVWFEYRPKWGGVNTPTGNNEDGNGDHCKNGIKDGNETGVDTGGDCGTGGGGNTFLEKNLKNRLLGINNYDAIELGLNLIKKYKKEKIANADDEEEINNQWYTLPDSETIYNKKRNYGRKQFTLTGLSRDTIYQYRIVAKTIANTALYPNPNPEQTFEGAIVEFRTKSVNDGTNPLAHCFNGVQDFGETGVDTGGGCPGKAPSCDDGIQNQNETGIDQGGVCKDKPIDNCTNGIQDFGETDVDTGGPCENPEAPDCPEGEVCGCPPGYVGTYPNCLPPALPTCDDGIQNNGETGIDTGGFCDDPNCVDGILNQDETGIDSGGICEGAPDPCFNGIQDGDETGIDKGGACGNDPRPNRCKNGIQDGDETGIDSGGSCGGKVTVDIKANPIYVVSPGSSNISWTSTNADTCKVNHLNAETVVLANMNKPSGSFKSINLNANPNRTVRVYNYTATCTGKSGSATDTVSVFAFPKLETVKVNLKVEPPKGKKGDIATVSWTSTNATSCESTGGGGTGTSGSFQTEKLEKSISYTVRCENKIKGIWGASTILIYVDPTNNDFTFENCFDNIKNGTETDIDVGPNCPDIKDRVTVDIKAQPAYVEFDGRSRISWTSKNAEWCIISNYQQGRKVGPSGEFSLINITSNRTYSAVCGGEKGEGSDSVNIFVYNKFTQVKVDLVAEKSIINKGETTKLSWTSTNATSCESTGGGGTGTSGSFETTTLNSNKTYSVVCKGGASTIPGNDTQLVRVKVSNDDTGSGGNGGGSCPEGWLQEDGSCAPTYTCPNGSTGIWPNCKFIVKQIPCPTTKGWSGTNWPDCKYTGNGTGGNGGNTGGNNGNPCPTGNGWSGEKWPDCKYSPECPNGWTGTYPNCKFTKECPTGTTGEYPNCKIDGNEGGNGNGGNNGNNTCPPGYSGVYPNCTLNPTCPVGYTGNPPTCVASTSCPTGWTGTWPTCTNGGGGNGGNNGGNGGNNNGNNGNNNGNNGNNNTCPNGTTGTWPTCTFNQTCPVGFTGTWPVCTSGPTTNIAHCSNGVQDFGETGIDIGGGCGGVYNSGATCFDNIKNGDETGIDEGGHCGDGPNNNGEYPSCFDNIKNGDETGIDIGGHCGNANTGTDWVDVVFPDANGTGTTTGTCTNGVCNGEWEGNFPGLNGPFSGSCRAGQYTDCNFTGNCVNGVCNGEWEGNFPGQNGPFVGTINGGLGDGRGLGNDDWIDSVFLNLAGEGTIKGNCVNGICSGEWKGVCLGVNGPLVGVWNSEAGTGPYTGNRENNKCSGKWNGVIAGNNGELLGKWKGDGIGSNDGKELYIGYEGIPDVDDIVRYHEGIEHVFIRRIMINTELARHYGYQKGQNLLHFAWDLAHTFAKEFGYVDNEGKEIRVSQPDVSAYQLRLIGDKLTVYEYYKNKIIDLRERTTVFKNKNSYEYYFTQ